MKASNFNIGDIVRCGSKLLCVAKIEGQTVCSKWDSYSLNEIEAVKIGSGYDRDIVLKSVRPLAASFVGLNDPIPVYRDYYFMKYSIDGVKIADVVKDNQIEYIHDLQKWLKENMPSQYLYFSGMPCDILKYYKV